jgi:hypothetical protein
MGDIDDLLSWIFGPTVMPHLIGLVMVLVVLCLFFPSLINPVQKERLDVRNEYLQSLNYSTKENLSIMVQSGIQFGYLPAMPQPDYYKNIKIIGKGDGFWGRYSCKLLATDGINYKIYYERLCQAAQPGETYSVLIGRDRDGDLVNDSITYGVINYDNVVV